MLSRTLRLWSLLPLLACAASSLAYETRPQPTLPGSELVRHASGRLGGFKTGPDSFAIYGGPGTQLGKFQSSPTGVADWQFWTTVDETDLPSRWQISTFNAENLNSHGPGNRAAWCGQDEAQQPGWFAAPGYGNSWDARLEYRRVVADPSQPQDVTLEFFFNYDVEPGEDFFHCEYDSAGFWLPVLSQTFDNRNGSGVFLPPGAHFPFDSNVLHPIRYGGGDYAGIDGNEIAIRFRAFSDGAWSDEDGLWDTDGMAQLDDILVASSEGLDFEDFEGPGPYLWQETFRPFFGDFAKIFNQLDDPDPCVANTTPLVGFMDDGTGPFNPSYTGAGTGGSTSPNWNYGTPGGWVVNTTGGVSGNTQVMRNRIVSPPFAWDLPGTADDGPEVQGARLRFSVWAHLPVDNGIFYSWEVRSVDSDGTGAWDYWQSYAFAYFVQDPQWFWHDRDITQFLEPGRDFVQVRVSCLDLANVFSFPGTDSTPGPWFDNFTVLKYAIGGPSISARTRDLFQDSFSQSGQSNVSTLGDRDVLDVRIDMAADVSTGSAIIPGDSMVVSVTSLLNPISSPSTQIQLHYSLNLNPLFEMSLRGNTAIGLFTPGTGLNGWDQVEGTINASQVTSAGGSPIDGQFFFDLPDVDFMYPGDVLEYYVEAIDDGGYATTLPADLYGYDDPAFDYDPIYRMRALPTYSDAAGTQPVVLWINDNGHRGGEAEILHALKQSGYYEGDQYDNYTVKGAASPISNGIGSLGAHGASPTQLGGYTRVLYFAGDLAATLSDGSSTGNNDKSNDVLSLRSWHDQPFDRCVAYFGDDICNELAVGTPTQVAYLNNVMNVVFQDGDVRDEIDFQTAPHVLPTGAVSDFVTDFVVYGGCPTLNDFDSIAPGPGAVRAHGFEILGSPGDLYAGLAASVYFDRLAHDGSLKIDITFPYSLHWIRPVPGKAAGTGPAAELLQEYFGHRGPPPPPPDSGSATPTPEAIGPLAMAAHPNPFNPRTVVQLRLPQAGDCSLVLYDLRGRRVRTLHEGPLEAGLHDFAWDGRDEKGRELASAIYLLRLRSPSGERTGKLALIR